MIADEKELDSLLGLLEQHVDLEHGRHVDERYRRALAFDPVDQPPLLVQAADYKVIRLPGPWRRFKHYSYRQTFDDPAAMMQNVLLDRVVPGILLRDDNPLAIRSDHGTIQVASLLGASWELSEHDYPWVNPCGPLERLREVARSNGQPDPRRGVMQRSLDTLKFYRRKLAEYPRCRQAIQLSLPDLQGPFDTAGQLWGSDICLAFADEPELLGMLLRRIANVMVAAAAEFRTLAFDRLDPFAIAQHGYVIPGRLLIRNDSATMLSQATYSEFVRPHDAQVLREVGGGSIHFCGKGPQLIKPMLEIPDLRGLDIGQPELMDVRSIYAMCRERNVVATHLNPSRDDLLSGKAARDFPTGCVFVYYTEDIQDARAVVQAYRSNSASAPEHADQPKRRRFAVDRH